MSKQAALEKHIERETEKAVLIRCLRNAKVWLPKSQIEIGNKYVFLPEWLLMAKVREAGTELGSTNVDIARHIEAEAA